jgi:hypothetical protein
MGLKMRPGAVSQVDRAFANRALHQTEPLYCSNRSPAITTHVEIFALHISCFLHILTKVRSFYKYFKRETPSRTDFLRGIVGEKIELKNKLERM